jgi:voltage-gated sodium channel
MPSGRESLSPAPPVSPAAAIVRSAVFQGIVLAAIVAGAILVGLETSDRVMAVAGDLVLGLDRAIIWFFVLEIVLRIVAFGSRPWRFFTDGWNVFDFLIVLFCVLPLGTAYVQVFRLARVLRVLRLASAVPGLQVLVTATLRSIPSMLYVVLLLVMLLYIYAVVGVFLFGENDPVHFANLPLALLTLFSVLTLEGWVDVLRIQMFGSAGFPDYPVEFASVEPISSAQPMAAVVYFVSFVLVGTMIVLNLFVGIVVQGMEAAHEEVLRNEAPKPEAPASAG